MTRFRAAAFDLDDTLLRDDLSISSYTFEVFHRLTDSGFLLIPASGRSQLSMKPFVDQIGNVPLYIACNGAEIWEGGTNRLLHQETFSVALGREIAGFAQEYHCYAQTYGGGSFFYNEHSVYADRYAKASMLTGVYVGDLAGFIQEPRTKILLMSEEDTITFLLQEARRRFGSRISVTSSKPYFLEFNPPRATKGIALALAAERLGIRPEEMIAFGDSLNDLPMLLAAGRSVAVANGRPEVAKQCHHVCRSNEEDGVAHYLAEHVLKEDVTI